MVVPFGILKKDVPLELARYIKNKVVESRRRGYYSLWAKKIVTNNSRSIKRLRRIYRTSNMLNVLKTRRANANMSKSGINKKSIGKEKFGVQIPRNIKKALFFDKNNKE